MKLGRQASNSSSGEFICNLQRCSVYGVETRSERAWIPQEMPLGRGVEQPVRRPWRPRRALARSRLQRPGAGPEQLRPQAHTELYCCFTPVTPTASLTTYYQYEALEKAKENTRALKARTGNLSVHQELGAAPRPYAEGLAETCLEPKEYPRAFPVYLWNA